MRVLWIASKKEICDFLYRIVKFFFKVVISLKTLLVMRECSPQLDGFPCSVFLSFVRAFFLKMVVLMPSLGRVTGHISFIIPGVFFN